MAAMALVLAACNKTPASIDVSLSITGSDQGFELSDGTFTSVTTFAEGDRIGLFAVMDGAVVDGINNLCLTVASDGTLQPADVSMTFPTGAVYYAYYPYQENLAASVNVSAPSALDFFAELSSSWNVSSDQSADGFKSSNLLVATGRTVADESLDLQFSPAMGLVRIGVTGTIYQFTNTDYDIPDYVVSGGKISFKGVQPALGEGGYLLIVKPGEYSISYTDAAGSQILEGVVDAGMCDVAKDGTTEVVEHNLQIGDFYLSDGTLLSKDASASEVGAADVIGIVVIIDPDRIGEGEKEALGGTAHGIVMASESAGYGTMYRWYTDFSNPDDNTNYIRDEKEIGFSEVPEISDWDELFAAANADIEGYRNYNLIITERAADVAAGNYPCFKAVQDFAAQVGGPVEGVSTGWFMPASAQLLDMVRNLGDLELTVDEIDEAQWAGVMSWGDNGNVASKINEAFEKISWSNKVIFSDYSNGMAAASQSSPAYYRYVDFGNHGWVDYLCYYKFSTPVVRPMLAF